MRLQFKILGQKFRELAVLLKRLQALMNKNSTFSLLVQKSLTQSPIGNIRFHIDQPNPMLMMIDAQYFVSSMNFKSIQDLAVITIDIPMFFQFLADVSNKADTLTFSLKKKEGAKYLQVEVDDAFKNLFRISITQKSIGVINFWCGIIQPTFKCYIQNKYYRQYVSWLNSYEQSIGQYILLELEKDLRNEYYLQLTALFQQNGEIKFCSKVGVQIGTQIKERRNIPKDKISLIKLVIDMNDNVHLLMKQDKQFAFQITGNAFNIQIKLNTTAAVSTQIKMQNNE